MKEMKDTIEKLVTGIKNVKRPTLKSHLGFRVAEWDSWILAFLETLEKEVKEQLDQNINGIQWSTRVQFNDTPIRRNRTELADAVEPHRSQAHNA